jgi:SpoVK/Ycf46/Vps4 family AAA+-type ATPase
MSSTTSDDEVLAASNDAAITVDHFDSALAMIKPRITSDLLKVYENFQKINQR